MCKWHEPIAVFLRLCRVNSNFTADATPRAYRTARGEKNTTGRENSGKLFNYKKGRKRRERTRERKKSKRDAFNLAEERERYTER